MHLGEAFVQMVATNRDSWQCRGCRLIDILVLSFLCLCPVLLLSQWVTKRMNENLGLLQNNFRSILLKKNPSVATLHVCGDPLTSHPHPPHPPRRKKKKCISQYAYHTS